MRDRDSRDAFYDESQAAALHSLALSPVQPLAWFLLAQIAYEREAYDTAADTLDWAVRTSHYMRHQARARALLALALWDLVDEATRVRSMAAVVDVITREIDVVADFATASGAETDLLRRLRSTEPGGVLLAARFQAAVNRSRHQAELQRIAYEEFSAMRQALIATSMLVTAAMPLPTLAMSVHDYMEIRRGDHPTRQPDSVDEYLSAVLDGLLVLGYFNREEGTALFCVPDRHVLDINVLEFRANLDLLLEQFAAEMPNFDALARTRSVGLVSLELLTVLYPCDD